MSHRSLLAAALAALALALGPARAAAESPLGGSFEFKVGSYKPAIDAGITLPAGSAGPYEKIFGSSSPLQYKLLVAKALPWRQFGALEYGLGVGYWTVGGHGLDKLGQPTGELTTLKIVPTSLTATWRGDFFWRSWGIPFVPFARASLERYNWWVTGPGGGTVKTGATNGYSYGGGLGLVLDVVDPTLARELDADSGVNHTMLVVEVVKTSVNDFSSKSSWDLSSNKAQLNFGLLFVW